jgi:alkylation response protein AidB-like acyl-CoA dehydrogenase
MNMDLSVAERALQDRAAGLGRELGDATPAQEIVRSAAAAGFIDGNTDPMSMVLVLDALATESVAAAVVLALHSACATSLPHAEHLWAGTQVGALTLATDLVAEARGGRLTGGASWVAPVTPDGVALLGASDGSELVTYAVNLDTPGVEVRRVSINGLRGVEMAHLQLGDAVGVRLGPTVPVMTRVRIHIAAVGLGVARRAVREALVSARGTSRGAGGEQTVQGLIADAATDLDAAAMLTWEAAMSPTLGRASMAKLASTYAAQRAVERATQVVGADSMRSEHIVGRLALDVRALELFAGRTEALREAVALELEQL